MSRALSQHSERLPLITPENDALPNPGIVIDSLAMGVSLVLIAVQISGESLMMATMGERGAAAGSLVGSLHALGIGAGAGFTLGTVVVLSQEQGAYVVRDGRRIFNYLEQGRIIKSGYVMAAGVGVISAAIFATTPFYLPHIVNEKTAEMACDFFKYYAIGVPADIISVNNAVTMSQLGGWKISLLAFASYRIPALAFAYFFGKQLDMGPNGIGLGVSTAAWLTCLWTTVWFRCEVYKKFHLFENNVDSLWMYIRKILSNGWKLSLQRVTEWVNLAAIALLAGAWSTSSNPLSIAIQTSLQTTSFFGTFFGGVAQTAMQIATRQGKTMQDAFIDYKKSFNEVSLDQYRLMQRALDRTFFLSNIVGMILAGVFATIVYFTCNAISKLFIPEATPAFVSILSSSLMLWTEGSLAPDAVRIVSSGGLRGYGDLLYPTLASLIWMTVVGFPVGAVISAKENHNVHSLFIARFISLILSIIPNGWRYYQHRSCAQENVNRAIQASSVYALICACDRSIAKVVNEDRTFQNQLLSYGFIQRTEDTGLFLAIKNGLQLDQHINLANELSHYLVEVNKNITAWIDAFTHAEPNMKFHLLLDALAKKYEVNIIVITHNDAVPLFFSSAKAECNLYLSFSNRFALLRGEPTQAFTQLIPMPRVGSDPDDIVSAKASCFAGFLAYLRKNPSQFAPTTSVSINVGFEA